MNENTKDIASVADDTKAIEAVKSGLKTTEKGNIRQTIENAIYVLNNDPMLKDSIKRNELSCKTDIVKEMNWRRRSKIFTDTDFNNIMLRMEKKYGITRDKNIKRAIDIVGNNNHYHPIVDKLESLQWDGKERLRRLFPRYLGIPESDYTYEATRLMMMGAVHRVFYPGIKFEYMICLVGGQGVGKSSFFSLLAMENEWFSDDIRKLDDENVYRKMQGHWIIEMAEMLATCNARSVEEIKSFLSRQSETYKVPYETHPEDRPRQCIFVGTSNNADFLPFDRSGNRRFIPLFADRSKAEHHPMDDEEETLAYVEQCWAEIMDKFHRGVETSLVFDKRLMDELIRMQKMCMPEDTKVGMIARFLDETKEEYVCSTMIFQKAFNREDEAPKNYESREIGSIMRNEFSDEWESVSTHRFEEYGPQRAWRRKNYQEADEDKDGFMQLSDDVELPFNL
ncbi:MAG: virulence-associated E family protein [Lachnospiraceae bacterium]|nr:virulence-associated E family protein [Lachnospiraceae bacterium]